MELVLFWLVFAILFWLMFPIVVGIIANSRNRSGFGWFLLSVLISPVLALILVLCLPSPERAETRSTPKATTAPRGGRSPMHASKAMDMNHLAASAKGARMPQKELLLKENEQFKAAVHAEKRRREKQDAAARAEARHRARWETER